VQASGETPQQLEKELASKLQSFISEPEVSVIVTEVRSQKCISPGHAAQPGSYPSTKPSTVRPSTPPQGLPDVSPCNGLANFCWKTKGRHSGDLETSGSCLLKSGFDLESPSLKQGLWDVL
jgi:hypothetical protein